MQKDSFRIRIRDWNTHFEADRSRQWKNLKWVPIPNKQGLGYKKIMHQKNGAEIFGCWNAIVQQGSLCDPRGDLSKYSIEELAIKTIIPVNIIERSISFIIQNLDWIEIIENLDKNVNNLDMSAPDPPVVSSMLCNSILSSSNKSSTSKGFVPPSFEEFKKYCRENKHEGISERAFKGYSEAEWHDSKGKKIKNWKQKLQHVWFRDENKDPIIPKNEYQQKLVPKEEQATPEDMKVVSETVSSLTKKFSIEGE